MGIIYTTANIQQIFTNTTSFFTKKKMVANKLKYMNSHTHYESIYYKVTVESQVLQPPLFSVLLNT